MFSLYRFINIEMKGKLNRHLHHNLETIEAASLSSLDLIAETLNQVLVDNTVGGSEEGKNVADEMALIVIELVLPVMEILGQVHFLGSPEGSLGFLVHVPNLHNETLIITKLY